MTYIIYDLPKDNITTILVMVFSFTFFTYNGQRLFRLRKIVQPDNIGERLKWVIKYQNTLGIFSLLCLIVGLFCAYSVNIYSWVILIPMGLISIFYVVPFYFNKQTLRNIPYLKIVFIGIVWSLIVIGLPFIDSESEITQDLLLALTQTFFFIIAITIPFDIRDLKFDRLISLKTIPSLLGVRNSILLSEICLLISASLLFTLIENKTLYYALIVGHVLTMIGVAFSNQKRKELFFAGLIEGTTILLYGAVILTNYFFL